MCIYVCSCACFYVLVGRRAIWGNMKGSKCFSYVNRCHLQHGRCWCCAMTMRATTPPPFSTTTFDFVEFGLATHKVVVESKDLELYFKESLRQSFPQNKRKLEVEFYLKLSRYTDIKYIVGEDWTSNLTSTIHHAQPSWYEHCTKYELDLLSRHLESYGKFQKILKGSRIFFKIF